LEIHRSMIAIHGGFVAIIELMRENTTISMCYHIGLSSVLRVDVTFCIVHAGLGRLLKGGVSIGSSHVL
jgi:hypothetical protein